MRKSITCPGDLPAVWQRKWIACRKTYLASRLFASIADAERAAFEDVRSSYWREASKARDGDDAPGFDFKNGTPFADDSNMGDTE